MGKRLTAYIKFLTYYYLCTVLIIVLHTLLTWDSSIYRSNELYANYSNLNRPLARFSGHSLYIFTVYFLFPVLI